MSVNTLATMKVKASAVIAAESASALDVQDITPVRDLTSRDGSLVRPLAGHSPNKTSTTPPPTKDSIPSKRLLTEPQSAHFSTREETPYGGFTEKGVATVSEKSPT